MANLLCPYCGYYLTFSYVIDINWQSMSKDSVKKLTPTVECIRLEDHSYFAQYFKCLANNKNLNDPAKFFSKSKLLTERLDIYSPNQYMEVINDYKADLCEVYIGDDRVMETKVIRIDSEVKDRIKKMRILL